MEFLLTEQPLENWPRLLVPPSCGALAVFRGLVRDHNEGRAVAGLEYSAYPELALKEGLRILEAARLRFALGEARVVHRLGRLVLGEEAVLVEAASAHRREAFEACHWILDEVKHRVPIWKQEQYLDGTRAWTACPDKSLRQNKRDRSSHNRSKEP